MKRFVLAATIALALPHMAAAAPTTFFGENQTPGSTVTGDPVTARDAFVSTLAPGVGIEDFESPTALPNIAFPVSSGNVTASLTGSSTVIATGPSVGTFATSGTRLLRTGGSGDFNISFDSAISAFGFYGTDIGDVSASLTLRLTRSAASGGGILDLLVPNTVGGASGSLLFFGFIDVVDSYTNIAFINAPNTGDVFGFDDMIVGDRTQIVNPPAIPLPAAGWMLLAGLGGMGLMRRTQKRQG